LYFKSFVFVVLLSVPYVNVIAETLLDIDNIINYTDIQNWPLVDVRELSERSQSPIPGSLELSSELNIKGNILLVASDNNSAIKIARKIEKEHTDTEVFVLDQGYKTLRLIHPELMPEKTIFSMPGTFNIPRNTCKQGNPIQVYSDKKR